LIFKATGIRLQTTENGQTEIILSTGKVDLAEPKQVLAKGKELAVEIKQHRIKRSLDANAYFWVMVSRLAEVLHTTKDELYLIMLDRYGVFTHIIVKPHIVEKVKQEWRTVRELGEVTVNGQTGIQLQCFFGSSTFDTKEMSRLIDGLVSECKEHGIDTMTEEQIADLKSKWGPTDES